MSSPSENKPMSKLGKLLMNSGSTPSTGNAGDGLRAPGSMLPPVLKEVSKLAASVASLSTIGPGSIQNLSSSATGNPRNKCALKPGYSLMDWIRLGNSGKDLTGVGENAGKLQVSPQELLKHNRPEDAWISIRGNVYNVTSYLPYHPGGVSELMRGVGTLDATTLFDEVHPWVNYEKMLSKCLVGRMAASLNSEMTTSVRFASSISTMDAMSGALMAGSAHMEHFEMPQVEENNVRFDWIQRHDVLFLFFYTGPATNAYFEIRHPFDEKFTFLVTFTETVFTFKLTPHAKLKWPPRFKVFYETGKIEVGFQKMQKHMWPTFGTLEESKRKRIDTLKHVKKFIVEEKILLNKEVFMLSMTRCDLNIGNCPIGHHIYVYNDENEVKEYSPVPNCLMSPPGFAPEIYTSPKTVLLIRKYPDGKMSNMLFNKKVGDIILGSEPHGHYNLSAANAKDYHVCLCGGVGLAPVLFLMQFLLEKRVKPIKRLLLVCYHQTVALSFLRKELENMAQQDERFRFCIVLTRSGSDWSGRTGRFAVNSCTYFLDSYFESVPLAAIHFTICGPTSFNSHVYKVLMEKGARNTDVYVFSSSTVPAPSKQIVVM